MSTTHTKKLLIIAHCPSENTQSLANALLEGANNQDVSNVTSTLRSPFDCDAFDVLESDAIILFTTENFGYMSGALKDFFERIYYPCLDEPKHNDGKPYALVIRAGLDGTGTQTSVEKIITGLKWRPCQDVTLCKGEFKTEFIQQCQQLGLFVSASLEQDLI